VAFEIVTIGTLADAFILLHKTLFDVLLVNLAVPDYEGIESLRGLILAAKEIPVVVVSSSYDEAQVLEAVRAGAEDYTEGSRMNSAAFERVILYSIERTWHTKKRRCNFRSPASLPKPPVSATPLMEFFAPSVSLRNSSEVRSGRATERTIASSY
jgi:DNA-binding NarL/FixJ family response regulator